MVEINETGLPSDDRTDAGSDFLHNSNVETRLHWGIYAFIALVFLAVTMFLINQTREITELMGHRYARPQLPWQTNESRRLRHEALMSQLPQGSPVPEPTIKLDETLYDQYPKQRELLRMTIATLLKDQNVNKNFLKHPICDGFPLERTDAVIVPFSTLEHPGDRKQMGITEAAYLCLQESIEDEPDALTIREFPKDPVCMKILRSANHQYLAATDGTPRMTKDGTPRIAINGNIVNEDELKQLKLTLLHEFLHAHNAPAYNPFLNFAHDDLTYLSEYNEMIYNLNLDSSKRRLNYFLWIGSVLGLITTGTLAYLALGGDNRLWAWVGWSNNRADKRAAP